MGLMRPIAVAILILLLITHAQAAVSGKVETLGFGSFIRPDTWTPLLVQIQSDETEARAYALQVVQLDLDGDEVIYTRRVTVNPGTQSVWTYFKPQPSNEGLPASGTANPSDLNKVLRVYLATEDGNKRLSQIDVGKTLPQALETGTWEAISMGQRTIRSGQKLVLIVGDLPNLREFSPTAPQMEGASELMVPIGVPLNRLPDSPLGYEAVDAIIWTTADSGRLSAEQFRAIRQYVRGGGTLVCVQSSEPGTLARFDDMLPVAINGTDDWSPNLAKTTFADILLGDLPTFGEREEPINPLAGVPMPLRLGLATPKDDAVVAAWEYGQEPANPSPRRPLIARHLYGLGSVAWSAINVADPALTRIGIGWPNYWQRVFGQKQDLRLRSQMTPKQRDEIAKDYDSRTARDIGATFTQGMNLSSRTSALVSIAFVVFIGYWAVAGPLAYLVLAARKQTQLSWLVYGATSILAVVLTLGVVRLMLGGAPELRHVSLVRAWCGAGEGPARVQSRVGIYLPQDRAAAPVALAAGDGSFPDTLTPLVINPRFDKRQTNPRDSRYDVPIITDEEGPTTLGIPFRSTLKKLQADWTGKPPARISGSAALLSTGQAVITGSLSNDTGQVLNNVMIIFRYPRSGIDTGGNAVDQLIYVRAWAPGKIIDLGKAWSEAETKLEITANGPAVLSLNRDLARGQLTYALAWLSYDLRSGAVGVPRNFDDSDSYRRSFPLASLFDAAPAMKNSANSSDRVDILRSGVRQWDASHVLACGDLLVLATSSSAPLPLPLTVDGYPPGGSGATLWQFILPLDRSQVSRVPTTQEMQDQ